MVKRNNPINMFSNAQMTSKKGKQKRCFVCHDCKFQSCPDTRLLEILLKPIESFFGSGLYLWKDVPYLLPWINLSMKIDDNRWGGIWSLSRTWWEFEQSIFENPCLPSNNYNPFLNFTMNSSKRSRPINRLWKTSQLFTYPICTAGPSIWIN